MCICACLSCVYMHVFICQSINQIFLYYEQLCRRRIGVYMKHTDRIMNIGLQIMNNVNSKVLFFHYSLSCCLKLSLPRREQTAWYNALEIKLLFYLSGKIKLYDLALRERTGDGFSFEKVTQGMRLTLGDRPEKISIRFLSQMSTLGKS